MPSGIPMVSQPTLFNLTEYPDGFDYAEEFITPDEERQLIHIFQVLPFQVAIYKEYSARRRIVSFGGRFDYSNNVLLPGPPIPEWLVPLRQRAAAWAGLSNECIHHALIAEYRPGTPLGWHRDVPDFESIVGFSLAGPAKLRFRRYPPAKPGRTELSVELAPRSVYTMQAAARWKWQHSVPPTSALRYSVTFRTLRIRPA